MKNYSVSELASEINDLLQGSFAQSISVEGEISNFSSSSAGHWYFVLKEEKVQIKAVMFKGANSSISPMPKNGDKVQVMASVSFYQERGDFQLICQSLSPLGIGKILATLEERKKRLSQEGLFDEEAKKEIPMFVPNIGIVTSSNAAALQDMCRIFTERNVSAHIHIFPCLVQGESSGKDIARAIRQADAYISHKNSLDVIIVARGGGSTEDLLSFSDEVVVRTIYEASTPIISGVGHEVDSPLSDFVADIRVPTPTAAASYLCDVMDNTLFKIDDIQQSLEEMSAKKIKDILQLIKMLSPISMIENLEKHANRMRQTIDLTTEGISNTIQSHFSSIKQRVYALKEHLEETSPHAIMKKGYALVYDEHNEIITHTTALQSQQEVSLHLQDGQKDAIIK